MDLSVVRRPEWFSDASYHKAHRFHCKQRLKSKKMWTMIDLSISTERYCRKKTQADAKRGEREREREREREGGREREMGTFF